MLRRQVVGSDTVYEAESLAEAEALRVILKHEKIEYSVGIGAGNVSCIFVNSINDMRLQKVLVQWQKAFQGISKAMQC